MIKRLYLMTVLFLYILESQLLIGQHLSWKNYTTDHGLPGNEVYDQMQDSKGYMWFATNHGICRFNGYEFIQPVDTSHLSGTEAFLPTEDSQGNIWFSRLDGSLWKIENDTVRAWENNKLIAPYIALYRPILQLKIAQNGDVWLALHKFGFLKINLEGILSEIREKSDGILFAKIDDHDINVLSFTEPYNKKGPHIFKLFQWNGSFIKFGSDITINFSNSGRQLDVLHLNNGGIILSFAQYFYLIENGKLTWESKVEFIGDKFIKDQNGAILIPSHAGKMNGLIKYESVENLKRGIYFNLLPDQYVTRILEDNDGGYWASTHHAGVFYCKNPNLEILNKATGLKEEDIVCMSDDGSRNIFLGTRPANIIQLEADHKSTLYIPPPTEYDREIKVIFYDKINKKLWANQELHSYEKGKWSQINQRKNGNLLIAGFMTKSITSAPDGNHIWVSSFSGFGKINAASGAVEHFGHDSLISGKERTFSVVQDKYGEIWVTTTSGLRIWRNNRYEMPPFDHPMLHHQPRNILFSDDESMIFSLSGNGILIKTSGQKWLHLSLKDGLVSNNIEKFYSSPDGLVYACSSAGLSILSNLGGKWNINNITEKDGLPSNQVNDVVKLNGVLWIATNKGLVKLKNLPSVKPISSPIVEKIWINNELVSSQDNARFAYNQNNITLRFYALHYRSDGKIPYRFRLSGADSVFTNSNTREVNFANLAPGKYAFQVQAQNEAGEWGSMTVWPFVIRAAWWQTLWFYGIVGFLIAAIFGIWYRDRLKKKQHEFEIATQIKDLEAAAVRAQMNPHFIFNSLNSIQHFIVENDKEAAIAYLAKFARLVRLALHGSVDGQHTLREEIEMLENYLALEQLRFRGKFNFSIELLNEIDPDDITIPPMLVQPFVENALLHGMKNKTEGGKIEITFGLKDNILQANIKDNGPGIHSVFSKFDGEGHKSVGMTLTKHRLEILTEQSIQDSYNIQEIKSAEGFVTGTSVTLSIPLL